MRTVGVSAKVERYSGVVENGWKAFQFWEAVRLGVICKKGERRYEMMFYCSIGVLRVPTLGKGGWGWLGQVWVNMIG